jgi:glycosyltransferase involved in cell wall biosynthesis
MNRTSPQPLTPSLSIIIPTLNEAERIGALLEELRKQRCQLSFEIIVSDGESEDETQSVVQQFEDVKLVVGTRGTARQRNRGAREANGELLIFMDADCLAPSQFLQSIWKSYKKFPFAVACPWFVAKESLAIRTIYFGFNVLFFLGQGWLRTGSGVCIIARRDVWQKCGGFDETMHLGEDIEFLRRASKFGLHRHLLVPLQTSGRRFQKQGAWNLIKFYARITPHLIFGRYKELQKLPYEAAPYQQNK